MFRKAMRFIKEKGAKIAPTAAVIGIQMAIRSYAADSDLGGLVQESMNTVATKGLNTFAAIIVIVGLVTGGMAIYNMSIGQQSGDPSQKEKGQHGLVAAIGCGVAAAFILGCKTIILNIITAAMG